MSACNAVGPGADFIELVRLKSRYCRYVDQKQWGRLRLLFCDDACFDGFGSAPPGAGLAQFIAGVSSRLAEAVSVHHCHMPEFEYQGTDRVRAVWAMEDFVQWPPGTAVREAVGSSGFRGYGYYEDEYVRTELGWRIAFSRLARLRLDPLPEASGEIVRGWSAPDPEWVESREGRSF